MTAFYKFTPSLIEGDVMAKTSVGRDDLVRDAVSHVLNAIKNGSTSHMLFLGPRGIGKSHILLRISHRLSSSRKVTVVRLAEEEYAIFTVKDLFRRILDQMHIPCGGSDPVECGRLELAKLKDDGKPVVLIVENLQVLFDQIRNDASKLRSIIQTDQSLSMMGSALTYFDGILSHDEPFYRFFDTRHLQGLGDVEIAELMKKRLVLAGKTSLADSFGPHDHRIQGIRLLTGGNPRLVHTLAELVIQKNSLDDLEKNLLLLLDQMTPAYQARMETMSPEQRRVFDTIALAGGPVTPTEITRQLGGDKTVHVVISQLRRMQKDGLVTTVKFSDKRGTRYEIVDRLCRIWRELRSAGGASHVKIFVDFMRLWYSRAELFRELDGTLKGGDLPYPHAKQQALPTAKKICCLLDAVSNYAILRLHPVVKKFIELGQLEAAKDEIQRARTTNSEEQNGFLKMISDVYIDMAELDLYPDMRSYVHKQKQKSIVKKINGLCAKGRMPRDPSDSAIIHTVCEGISDHLLRIRHLDLALYFNDIAYGALDGGIRCLHTLVTRTHLKMLLGKHQESMQLVEMVLQDAPDNTDALLLKAANLLKLEQCGAALECLRQLLDRDVTYFVPSVRLLIERRLEQDILDLTARSRVRLLNLDKDRRSDLMREYVRLLCHSMLHAISDDRGPDMRFFSALMSSVGEFVDVTDVLYGCATSIFGLGDDVNTTVRMMDAVRGAFGDDKSEGLSLVADALDYVECEDPSILEKLPSEKRELAMLIIRKMSPKTRIGRNALESVGA